MHITSGDRGYGGFFRADPSIALVLALLTGWQATLFSFWLRSDSRKNRPPAEGRASFWSFFLSG